MVKRSSFVAQRKEGHVIMEKGIHVCLFSFHLVVTQVNEWLVLSSLLLVRNCSAQISSL